MKRNLLGLLAWLCGCFGAGAVGSLFQPDPWYVQLQKPDWNPPSWVFAPVWTILYLLMAIAAWRVWRRFGFVGARFELSVFLVQLLLNAIWSPIFFGLHLILPGFVVIMLLWTALVVTTVHYFRKDRTAGWLLIPYVAWVSFAGALNFDLWQLNR